VPDPAATKPADWDDEEDGDWEAPIVANPKCKVGSFTYVDWLILLFSFYLLSFRQPEVQSGVLYFFLLTYFSPILGAKWGTQVDWFTLLS